VEDSFKKQEPYVASVVTSLLWSISAYQCCI